MTDGVDPSDKANVTLSDDIAEQLAAHAFNTLQQRMLDQDPSSRDLRGFSELDEGERSAHLQFTREALNSLVALGYRIVPGQDSEPAARSDSQVSIPEADDLLSRLQEAEREDRQHELSTLLQIWGLRQEEDLVWSCQPEIYRHLGRRFLRLGEAPLAREVVQTALELAVPDETGASSTTWGRDIELRQTFGLALARSGNPDLAQRTLKQLGDEGHHDEETLGILARTYKDQAFRSQLNQERFEELLGESLDQYRKAYRATGGFWTGINVATLARLLGREDESQGVAEKVRSECLLDLNQTLSNTTSGKQAYWHYATLGEASLNLGDLDDAERQYRKAHEVASRNYGDLAVTRRHARLLLDYWRNKEKTQSQSDELLDRWLPLSQVVVFSGHMIDHKDRSTPRFPKEASVAVEGAIRRWLTEQQAYVGYSSAACGSDLLFQKVMQELGGESRIILPYDIEPFRADSVAFAGPEWLELFDEVIANATQLIVASPKRGQRDGVSFEYANVLLHGLATVRATELHEKATQPVGLVVWDGEATGDRGGTSHAVRHWQGLGMDVHQIDVSRFESPSGEIPIRENPDPVKWGGFSDIDEATDTRIMAMLFGDAVNFSQLDEHQVGRFIEHFMHPIANIIHSYGEANAVRNTWGDGIYLVFKHVREAGLCALQICEFVNQQVEEKLWRKHGLPDQLNVRIALHAGPVFGCVDPITGRKNYTGTHVSRAARLEPKTPPGEVYASEAFAALCAQDQVEEFSCHYVKQLAWAKHYGSFPTYVLKSAT